MKGEVRSPVTTWIISLLCQLYGIYMCYVWATELKNYLGKEDINPVVEAVIAWCCLPFGIYRLGGHLHEAQTRAGVASGPEPMSGKLAIMWFVCGLGYKMFQEELNKVWESGGGTPATF